MALAFKNKTRQSKRSGDVAVYRGEISRENQVGLLYWSDMRACYLLNNEFDNEDFDDEELEVIVKRIKHLNDLRARRKEMAAVVTANQVE